MLSFSDLSCETILDGFVNLMKYSRCFCDFELPCSLVVCSGHATAHRDMKSSMTHCNRPSNAALLSQTYLVSRYDILRHSKILWDMLCVAAYVNMLCRIWNRRKALLRPETGALKSAAMMTFRISQPTHGSKQFINMFWNISLKQHETYLLNMSWQTFRWDKWLQPRLLSSYVWNHTKVDFTPREWESRLVCSYNSVHNDIIFSAKLSLLKKIWYNLIIWL